MIKEMIRALMTTFLEKELKIFLKKRSNQRQNDRGEKETTMKNLDSL